MKKSQIKIKSFVIDERKETEMVVDCTTRGLPALLRKKKRRLKDVQIIGNKSEEVSVPTDSTDEFDLFQQFDFNSYNDSFSHENFLDNTPFEIPKEI
ncbi:hypothetical protein TVAG_404840 [Trichomonas vaginalis G3]|uniref:Uncharacterized protein n=1 Tax=Trichomonas vaginalis (strain ATCC PRA-98 / G3) TaxID=412133 RepID=A2E302_TRIV3|nr:hypothetical protein TVAGG3_0847780 [Trichomonas vaginalis G3]EAY12938.1 hypothetical protein TVAG_404840 [Trichomonas vaginalis G3]KAI5499751.1 hypothetical protein TVAGG3_0847780 [Trichomonas vaginalis G3]|eukprot:XP_001325161.1 hypothetical protein [Trichomonas vaginalis G3]